MRIRKFEAKVKGVSFLLIKRQVNKGVATDDLAGKERRVTIYLDVTSVTCPTILDHKKRE